MDHLSSLPDYLLHYILSFMPTVDAARTSLLSRRWRNAWTCAPALIFSQDEMDFDCEATRLFVSLRGALQQHQSLLSLQEFRLSFAMYNGEEHPIHQLLDYALSRGVEVLDLDFVAVGRRASFKLHCNSKDESDDDDALVDEAELLDGEGTFFTNSMPQSLFDYGLLRVLRLRHCSINPCGTLNFQFLDTLLLELVVIWSKKLQHLISSCPLLRDLELVMEWEGTLRISNSLLRILKVKSLCHEGGLIIDAPNLVYFHYHVNPMWKKLVFSVCDCPSLLHADLNLYHSGPMIREGQCKKLRKFLKNFSRVEVLKLSCKCLEDLVISEVLSESLESFPPFFGNLKRLELNGSVCNHGMFAIVTLLKAAPGLESLHISLNPTEDRDLDSNTLEAEKRILETVSIESLQQHLTVVKITGYMIGCIDQRNLVNFLLEKAKLAKVKCIHVIKTSLREKLLSD